MTRGGGERAPPLLPPRHSQCRQWRWGWGRRPRGGGQRAARLPPPPPGDLGQRSWHRPPALLGGEGGGGGRRRRGRRRSWPLPRQRMGGGRPAAVTGRGWEDTCPARCCCRCCVAAAAAAVAAPGVNVVAGYGHRFPTRSSGSSRGARASASGSLQARAVVCDPIFCCTCSCLWCQRRTKQSRGAAFSTGANKKRSHTRNTKKNKCATTRGGFTTCALSPQY